MVCMPRGMNCVGRTIGVDECTVQTQIMVVEIKKGNNFEYSGVGTRETIQKRKD